MPMPSISCHATDPMTVTVAIPELRRLLAYKRFAHHPTCEGFRHHLIRIFGRSLCLGCTCFYTGFTLALLFMAIFHSFMVNFFILWAVAIALFFPTLVQIHYQKRLFKIASRTLLGVSVAIMSFTVLFLLPLTYSGFFIRLIFGLLFFAVFSMTTWYRRNNMDNPCRKCPQGVYPFCRYKLDELKQLRSNVKGDKEHEMLVDFLDATIENIENPDGSGRVEFVFL